MVEKVEIHKLNFPVANIYNYNAMIFRSVDGGKHFFIVVMENILQL